MVVNRAKVNRQDSTMDALPLARADGGEGGQGVAMAYKKPSLSLLQMVLLNAVVCGLEFCASAGFTYIPPLLLKAGLSESRMSFVIGFGPLLGLFFVPAIGKASDQCRSSYGRRRPFILALSLGCILSLLVIPYAQILTERVFGMQGIGRTFGVLLLCFGVVLLDFTTQACLNPCEALLSDASKGTSQQDSIFTVYSVMISLGGCLGYFITAIDWKTSSLGLYFSSQEQSAFSLLIVLFSITMLATLLIAEEKPVSSIPGNGPLLSKLDGEPLIPPEVSTGQHESGYETSSNSSVSENISSARTKTPHRKHFERTNSISDMLKSVVTIKPVCNIFTRHCDLNFRSRLLMFLRSRCRSIQQIIVSYLPSRMRHFWDMPVVLKNLVMADFCCWTAVMGFNFFYTDFMGQVVYSGRPNAPENSNERDLYDQGVRMGSWGLLFHCIVSAVFAPFVERLSERFGPRKTLVFGMTIFTVAMFCMVFLQSVAMVTLMASLTGFAYACITIIPFTLVTEFHSDKEVG